MSDDGDGDEDENDGESELIKSVKAIRLWHFPASDDQSTGQKLMTTREVGDGKQRRERESWRVARQRQRLIELKETGKVSGGDRQRK